MKTTCLFCEIANKKVNASVIYEDKAFLVFLDIKPLQFGHCLLIPKSHVATFYDLPENQLQIFFKLSQNIGLAVQDGMQAQGTFIAMNNTVSQSVSHLHLHIVPRNFKDGLKGFFWPRKKYPSSEFMLEVKNRIQTHLR